MKFSLLFSLVLVSVFALAACTSQSGFPPESAPAIASEEVSARPVIWEEDTREEVVVADATIELARATAVMFHYKRVVKSAAGGFEVIPNPLKSKYNFCAEEKFLEQNTLGHCSGVLIGPRQVLTAGHCMREKKFCDQSFFTFGRTEERAQSLHLSSDEVYSCKQIIKYSEDKKNDYAIIELDRDVTQAKPVSIAKNSSMKPKEKVLSLSYPLGLPLKKDHATILRDEGDLGYLRAKTDTYSGSSGSPLFNSKNELVAILVQGSDDFEKVESESSESVSSATESPAIPSAPACKSSKLCIGGFCLGERYLKTDRIFFPAK